MDSLHEHHPPATPSGATPETSIRRLRRVLHRRRYLIWLVTAAGLIGGVAFNSLVTPRFSSAVTVEVNQQSSDGGEAGISSAAQAVLGAADIRPELETQVAILKDQAIALDVIRRLDLPQKPPFNKVSSSISFDATPETPSSRMERERLLRVFQQSIKAEIIPNTRLIQVSVTSPDPALAASIANTLIAAYVNNHLSTRYAATRAASEWMTQQLEVIKGNVARSQAQLSDFERKTGLVGVTRGSGGEAQLSESGNSALSQLNALNQQFIQAQANRIAKETIFRLVNTRSADVIAGLDGTSLASAAGFQQNSGLQNLLQLRAQQTNIKLQLAAADTRYADRNPHMLDLRAQDTAITKEINQELARIAERTKNDYLIAKETEAKLKDALAIQQQTVGKLNDDAIRLGLYFEDAQSSRQLYELLFNRLQEANVSMGMRGANISVVNPALAPAYPYFPRRYYIPGAAIIAFIGILAACFAADSWTAHVSSPGDSERILGNAPIGTIPRFLSTSSRASADRHKEHQEEQSWLVQAPHSPVSESLRTLRTNLLLLGPRTALKTIAVTSSMSGEGKSTLIYNLAVAFAQNGSKCILIDADLRKPRIHRMVGIAQSPGLSTFLSGSSNLDELAIPHPRIPNLYIAPSGPHPPFPSELLGNGRLSELLKELRGQYDFVFIDCSPVLLVTDALVVGALADAVLLVVRMNRTTMNMLRRLYATVTRALIGKFLLVVENDVDTSSPDYYYAYGYYGSSSGYGGETDSK